MQALSSTANIATRCAFTPAQNKQQRRSAVSTQALFTKKKPVVVEEVKPAPKRSFFGKKAAAPVVVETTPGKTGFSLFGKKTATATPTTTKTTTKAKTTKVDKAATYKKQESILSAFDFSTARSQSDAELLYDARYGKLENGKMSKEQYAALRRKIGGTSKDFFKGWVEVKGEYTDKGYVAKEEESTNVPALPFLVGVVLALFGTVGYVVAQTSQ
jgi:hypothetical protein